MRRRALRAVPSRLPCALFCHCKRCQRRTGTGRLDHRPDRAGSYRTVSGEDLIASWDPGDGGCDQGLLRASAAASSSPTNPENPEMVAIRMGALDEDPGIRPSAHQFVTYAAPWAPVPDDGLPRFPERITDGPPLPDPAG